jgi:alkylhydroperoxidase family enzyme
MARYLPIQKDAATDSVKEIYNAIEKDFGGLIPNVFKTVATSSAFLEAFYEAYRAFVMGECSLNEKLRSLVLLKASKADKSAYGTALYTDLAKKSGVTDDQVKAIDDHEKSELFTYDEKLLLSHTEMVTKDPTKLSADFFKFLKNHYTQQQVVEMTTLAAFATMVNHFCKALEVDADKK